MKFTPMNRRKFLAGLGAGAATILVPRSAKAAVGFADQAIANLKGFSVGVQLTVTDNNGNTEGRSAGWCRLPHSGVQRVMSHKEQYNVASVSKVITGTAMLRALYDNPNISLNTPFASCLPSHWTIHSSLTKVTFAQLLQHKSGIRDNGGWSYSSLKAVVLDGVNPKDIGTRKYNNLNYAMMRLLIPRVANAAIPQIAGGVSGSSLHVLETLQAAQFAGAYLSYVQQHVWDKTGITPGMQCKPISSFPALCYQYPNFLETSGDDFGDMTLVCGGAGWNTSTNQLAAFMRTLHSTQQILPSSLSQSMIDQAYGYDGTGSTPKGTLYWQKGGDFPGSQNDGQLHSYVIGFANNVYIAMIVNSPFVKGTDFRTEIGNAFDAAYN